MSGNPAFDSGLEAIEPWIEGYLSRLKPGERMRLSRRLGQLERKQNAARIRANVQADGTAMEPRKPKKHRGRKGNGAMFRRIGRASNLRIFARIEEVELAFAGRVAATAAVHHFGLLDKVDHRIRNSISVRYPERHLLDIGPDDRGLILDEVLDWFSR